MSRMQEFSEGEARMARELGLRLYELRHSQHLSQLKVASSAGMSLYSYQRLERGVAADGSPFNPQLITLSRACEALGTTISSILEGLG